jgi:hypothetical protein
MYKIIELEVDGETWFVVYNKIKKIEEARFTTNNEAMSFIIGK